MKARNLLAACFFTALCSTTTFVHQFDNACSEGSSEINGNWYCSNSVKAITFTGFQQAGSYSRVIDMDSGQCTQDSQTFGSSLGPFGSGNDISWHFRGPLQLNEFAYYTLSNNAKQKRNRKPSFHERRHGHAGYHGRNKALQGIEERHVVAKALQKRGVCDLVSATFGTTVATWVNLWDGKSNVPSSVCETQGALSSPTTQAVAEKVALTTTITYKVAYASTATSAGVKNELVKDTPGTTEEGTTEEGPTGTTTVTITSGTSTSTIKNSAKPGSSSLTSSPTTTSLSAVSAEPAAKTSPSGANEEVRAAPDSSSLIMETATTVSSSMTSEQNAASSLSPSTEVASPLSQSKTIAAASSVSSSTLSKQLSQSSSISSTALPQSSSSATSSSLGTGNYVREAYYSAPDKSSTGFTFLNHNGGQGSGTWDSQFGNSLSFASSDATSGSATAQIFGGYLDDNVELVVHSDSACTSSTCGYARPDSVAYQAFDNAEALFLLDFAMPLTNKQGFNMDMPAIWILNAQIPRTLQYGNAQCSCWATGCGELDLFEVLDPGDDRMKSTWHGANAGGSSYWFQRPQTSQKAAVLLSESQGFASIFYLPDDADFSTAVDSGTVSQWITDAASEGALFTL